ncbi:MAG: S8 family serine peptidase [Parvularcula sp.]
MARDSWIFVFDNSVAKSDVRTRADAAVRSQGGKRGHVFTTALRGFSAQMPAQAAAKLAASNPNILYYEADQVGQIIAPPPGKGPGGGGDGGGSQPAQVVPWGITRVGGGVTTSTHTAWVIDTGVQQDHPDLNVDTARSANFVSKGKYTVEDGNGHGTHVAGTIAAIDNDIGVVGVAPGSLVVGVRVLNNRGSGTYSDIIAGIDYVSANAAIGDVANMSLGGGFSQALNDAVQNAAANGIKFALAAGNESTDAGTKSPASTNGNGIWTVSASDSSDSWASFSNYGNPPVDCAAPGVGVLSTVAGSGYDTYSGTSMASPHVAGILLLGPPAFDGTVSGDPDGNPDQICVVN